MNAPQRFNSIDEVATATRILFLGALGLALASGSFLWAARVGWMILAVLGALYPHYLLYTIFFFSAFFHNAGFAPDLFFTIKHFHIAIGLWIVVSLIRGEWGNSLKLLPKAIRFLSPVIGIVFIGILNFLIAKSSVITLLTPANLLSVIISMCLVVCGILSHKCGRGLLLNGIVFYLWGVAFLVLAGVFNKFYYLNIFETSVIHNNHTGILCAISIFHTFSRALENKPLIRRLLDLLLTAILTAGLIASCSRTSWFSFIFAFIIYACLIKYYVKNMPIRSFRIVVILLVIISAALIFTLPNVWLRLSNINQLIDPEYWKYTINDHQNFGFLGIFRLRDFQLIANIFSLSPIVGIGFQKEVVDAHGLYCIILGSTGLSGLLLFAYFSGQLIYSLWKTINTSGDGKLVLFSISTLCSITAWTVCSLMESYYVHFSIWLQTAIAISIIGIAAQAKSPGAALHK